MNYFDTIRKNYDSKLVNDSIYDLMGWTGRKNAIRTFYLVFDHEKKFVWVNDEYTVKSLYPNDFEEIKRFAHQFPVFVSQHGSQVDKLFDYVDAIYSGNTETVETLKKRLEFEISERQKDKDLFEDYKKHVENYGQFAEFNQPNQPTNPKN